MLWPPKSIPRRSRAERDPTQPGSVGAGAYKLNQNWVVNGGIRYDIENAKPSQTRFGFGYIDDCFMASFQYYTDYAFAGSLTSSQTYMLQISLRTIGSAGFGFH